MSSKTKVTDAKDEYFISLKDNFDIDMINIDPPEKIQFKSGNSYVRSKVYVLNKQKEELPIFMELEQQNIFGIQGVWPRSTPPEKQVLDNIENYQINYPITSRETAFNPTQREKMVKERIDALWEKVVEKTTEFCENDDDYPDLPEVTTNSYNSARMKEQKKNIDEKEAMKNVIKLPYRNSMSKDGSTGEFYVDTNKPYVMPIKFMKMGSKDRGTLKITTPVHGPGNKIVSPSKYLSGKNNLNLGKAKVLLKIEGIYWGGHGQAPYGCSIQLRVGAMTFTPLKMNTGAPSKNLISNDDPESEDINENDTDFPHPTGEKQETKEEDFQDKDVKNLMSNSKENEDDVDTSTNRNTSASSAKKTSRIRARRQAKRKKNEE